MSIHANLAEGRWQSLSLNEQLGNVSSEIGRALATEGGEDRAYQGAVARSLELLDLCLSDPRWSQSQRKEISRAREVVADTSCGGHLYGSTFKELDRYFTPFAFAARASR